MTEKKGENLHRSCIRSNGSGSGSSSSSKTMAVDQFIFSPSLSFTEKHSDLYLLALIIFCSLVFTFHFSRAREDGDWSRRNMRARCSSHAQSEQVVDINLRMFADAGARARNAELAAMVKGPDTKSGNKVSQ